MENVWALAAVWVGLALIATLVAIWFKISTALSEIVVGTVAQLIIGAFFVRGELRAKAAWVTFLAGTGAIILTFLAGAELDPQNFHMKWEEATVIGLVDFFGPFLGCTAIAHFIVHWTVRSSWLAGVALSTTSVAVVYAVMLELGFNVTDFGKAVLAACFIKDFGTVIALGLIFSPFTIKTLIFVGVSIAMFLFGALEADALTWVYNSRNEIRAVFLGRNKERRRPFASGAWLTHGRGHGTGCFQSNTR